MREGPSRGAGGDLFFLALILALPAFSFSSACGSGGGASSEGGDPPCPGRALSVSAVNGWPGIDADAYADELATNCQALVEIEALPWFDRSGPCDQAHPTLCTEPFRDERRALLRAMSAHKITTYVVTENSNAYGPRLMTDLAFRAHVQAIREDALAVGIENVWLGAPSEPWAWEDGARRRSLIAREEWPGVFVMPDLGGNRPTGRPYFQGVGYDYLEVHPCSIEDALASIRYGRPILTVTDCSPVLNPGVEMGSALALAAVKASAPLVLYDHGAFEPDGATIEAIGAVVRAGL